MGACAQAWRGLLAFRSWARGSLRTGMAGFACLPFMGSWELASVGEPKPCFRFYSPLVLPCFSLHGGFQRVSRAIMPIVLFHGLREPLVLAFVLVGLFSWTWFCVAWILDKRGLDFRQERRDESCLC